MTTPPDYGGHEIEEGLLEDLGGPQEKYPVPHDDEAGSDFSDNELHAFVNEGAKNFNQMALLSFSHQTISRSRGPRANRHMKTLIHKSPRGFRFGFRPRTDP